MDKEFFENKEGCSVQEVKREEVIKDLESKGPEAAQVEIGEMLDEISGVMNFLKDRFADITNRHQALCAVGALGLVAGVSFCEEPVTFTSIGTKKALDNTFKVIMAGMVSRED